MNQGREIERRRSAAQSDEVGGHPRGTADVDVIESRAGKINLDKSARQCTTRHDHLTGPEGRVERGLNRREDWTRTRPRRRRIERDRSGGSESRNGQSKCATCRPALNVELLPFEVLQSGAIDRDLVEVAILQRSNEPNIDGTTRQSRRR